MSSQEMSASSADTPQQTTITLNTLENDSQSSNSETQADLTEPENKDSPDVDNNQSDDNKVNNTSESDNYVVRSESVIKSPSKPSFVSSPTPVIKVVDSSQESPEMEDSNETKRSIETSVIAQTSNQITSPQSATSFLHSATSPTPSNPFLRTSSFSSNFTSAFESSDQNSDSSFSFAPPKLVTPFSSNNLFDTSANFLRPSVLKTADSNNEGNSETISTSKNPFISLNKEDIGKIKTPSFIKNSLDKSVSSFSNGSSSTSNKEREDLAVTDDIKPFFTFGQNLSDRVVFDCKPTTVSDLKAEINSTSDNLISFSDVTNNETSIKDNSSDSIKSDDSKNEHESIFNSVLKNGDTSDGVFKRKYEVITGEEDEQNVLSIHGKLYAWDTAKAIWTEKGRGNLRLNDVVKNDKLCSRLVMRTSGALRVILNAHVVAGMKFELANDNCLRFTNVDGIYLIKANPKDIDQLNSAIEYRLREMNKRVKTDHEDDSCALVEEDDKSNVDSI